MYEFHREMTSIVSCEHCGIVHRKIWHCNVTKKSAQGAHFMQLHKAGWRRRQVSGYIFRQGNESAGIEDDLVPWTEYGWFCPACLTGSEIKVDLWRKKVREWLNPLKE